MPIKQSITSQDVCDLLNELIELDATAVNNLFLGAYALVGEEVANHPTIQVGPVDGSHSTLGGSNHRLRLLGIINGFFGIRYEDDPYKGWGAITLCVDKMPFKFVTTEAYIIEQRAIAVEEVNNGR